MVQCVHLSRPPQLRQQRVKAATRRLVDRCSLSFLRLNVVTLLQSLSLRAFRRNGLLHTLTLGQALMPSWLVCRGADYALRLRPAPRVAQALLSCALSEIALPARSRVGWTASRHFHVVCDLEASDLESEPVCTSRASASIPGVCRGHPSRATEKKSSLLFGS